MAGAVPKKAALKMRIPLASSTLVAQPRNKPGTLDMPERKHQHPLPPKEFTLPAFSLPFPKNEKGTFLEQMKKKTIRRNAPPGEDLKAIKEILRSIKGSKDITVQDFIVLMAPSLGDRGECLRYVMNEDIQHFRKLARKVYEMITQDNSDVLLNQQLQLSEYYKEKKTVLQDKMWRALQQIFDMAPDFCFDRYFKEHQKYLDFLFPLPAELQIVPEEVENMRSQKAYHRLQWLNSERERLNQENSSLRKRLNQLKKLHMVEQEKQAEKEREAEEKRTKLEAAEAAKQDALDELNTSLEKSIINQELTIRQKLDADVLQPVAKPSTGAIPKQKAKGKQKIRRPKWNECAAAEIESTNIEEYRQTQSAAVPRERSPFHFSPPKEWPMDESLQSEAAAWKATPPRAKASAPSQQQSSYNATRRNLAPQDSWGGFY